MNTVKRLMILGITALLLGSAAQAETWNPITGPFPPRGPGTCGGPMNPCELK